MWKAKHIQKKSQKKTNKPNPYFVSQRDFKKAKFLEFGLKKANVATLSLQRAIEHRCKYAKWGIVDGASFRPSKF